MGTSFNSLATRAQRCTGGIDGAETLFCPMFGRYVRNLDQMSAFIGTAMQNRRNSFEYEDLLACGRGEMFAEGPQLPLPPMLMFDRISEIAEAGGEYGKGIVRAV